MIFTILVLGVLLTGFVLTLVSLGPLKFEPWLFLAAMFLVIYYVKKRERAKFVTWKPEYSVGVAALDDDHKKLLNLINQFQTAVHYNTGEKFESEALMELVEYTKTHFKREEDLMEQNGYESFDAHKAEHEKMIGKVEEHLANYEAKGHRALPETAKFLTDWLINHINGTDQQYSKFLNDKGVH